MKKIKCCDMGMAKKGGGTPPPKSPGGKGPAKKAAPKIGKGKK
jgi:hypothetical protein